MMLTFIYLSFSPLGLQLLVGVTISSFIKDMQDANPSLTLFHFLHIEQLISGISSLIML